MTSPRDTAQFHAEYDVHTDDRVRLFRVISDFVDPQTRVLYPGSYVDIAPSVWFDDVTYLDMDKRTPRFFGETAAVGELVSSKRRALGMGERRESPDAISFHHLDYQTPIPEPLASFGLLVSLYAGFISEHCTAYLEIGGTLLVNPSHGDAAMASIDPRYELAGVVISNGASSGVGGDYSVSTTDLETYRIAKQEQAATVESLHASGRGVGYTRSPFAYLFTRVAELERVTGALAAWLRGRRGVGGLRWQWPLTRQPVRDLDRSFRIVEL